MKIGILKEHSPEESRVAATPETVAKMVKNGLEVWIEQGAGLKSSIQDDAFKMAGANIIPNPKDLLRGVNVVLKVEPPSLEQNEISLMEHHTTLISPFNIREPALMQQLIDRKITAFSLDQLPRIARAQSMDILSSMSNIAGYKSVILAADHLGKIFPMLTTAAGTILPVKVVVVGAGVAGLQAIATARRLGAIVKALDTRPQAAEQVKSLGAEFISLETSHTESQDQGGYAKEQSATFYQQEQTILSQAIKDADVVITTALIPGKKAPRLITVEMVQMMQEGGVIVDLAAQQGGNCALTEPGKIIKKHGITIIGLINLPSLLPIHTSQLFARNVYAFLNYIVSSLNENQFDLNDEIIKQCLITHQGNILHPIAIETMRGPS